MKWSMDTHKYISEITRKTLQIMVAHNLSSDSEPEEIDTVERELAAASVYKDYESAKGRVRRALFTYFKAYGCLDEHEHLTELGQLYVENKITIQEFCFYYTLNYEYHDDETRYYPVQLVLNCLKKLKAHGEGQAYISPYDFSKIVDCQSSEEIDDGLINGLIEARQHNPIEVNERTIGYDVWAKMLVQAGILDRTTERNLVAKDWGLIDWILEAYENQIEVITGTMTTGVFKFIPLPPLDMPEGDATRYHTEGKALQSFLFDAVDESIINKYIVSNSDYSVDDILKSLGLKATSAGYYKHFLGLEHLIGYCLMGYQDHNIQTIGSILATVELTEAELTDVMPIDVHLDFDSFQRKDGGSNILLYGVPGSGKSWTIEHEYCPPDSIVERLVFHPDYTNSDFVGQILPVVDKDNENQVTYEFTPGPFTAILKDAYTNPLREFILIIEEINRGNAPAIFGEIFQLLDRIVDEKIIEGVKYPTGTSEYGITNRNIAEVVYGDGHHKVRLPSNLSILGTMNTSDQNVFTLDTAFQRRWKMRLIENNFENVRKSLADAPILDTGVTWQRFCETMNKQIVGNKTKMSSSEDKRLGVYFVHENDLQYNDADIPVNHDGLLSELNELLKSEMVGTIADEGKARLKDIRAALMQNRIFPEKVIKYLWDDAFKFNPEAVFDTVENKDLDSLEAVIRMFIYEKEKARFNIFKKAIRDLLYQ